jgi:two-component system chemotaxis response regulator CheB
VTVRVFICDDSVAVRGWLVRSLHGEGERFEVIATASNGAQALEKLSRNRPDVIILDIEMPELDGLEFLSELNERNIRIPVIVFSSVTERGASVTVEALSRGAADYLTKPSTLLGMGFRPEEVFERLKQKLEALSARGTIKAGAASSPTPATIREKTIDTPSFDSEELSHRVAARPPPIAGQIECIVIGSSTGGPRALAEALKALPKNLSVPVFIAQHMPPVFTTHLARSLDRTLELEVREAEGGEEPQAGTAYIAPGDRHMELYKTASGMVRIDVNDKEPLHYCRPAVDRLFRSAADVYGRGVLACVLTGMGADGCDGSAQIVDRGGHVIVQDEATSIVWGMPGEVARAGLASAILPLDEIAPALRDLYLGQRR